MYARSIILEEEEAVEALEEWGRQVSGKLVSLRLPLDIALAEISHYREIIGDHIKEEAKEQQLTFDEFYQIVAKFNRTVDKAVLMTSRSFMDDFEDTIKKAQYAVNELSIPVVRITEEAGIIPIVGEIDTNRAQILMENALSEGIKFDLDTIIIDLSGVSIIDTMVAHQIFRVIDSLKLTGIEAIISGIRPDIVQTMVSLGIDMKHVETYSSLHRAIKKVVNITTN
ncbi:STAS domain-containing protein [Thalassobacillus pellis]|uniref:STAS domain-containing protein n=1 Tax=Thalassobacillus pellis TaxID=748008 RepID=UPI00308409FE